MVRPKGRCAGPRVIRFAGGSHAKDATGSVGPYLREQARPDPALSNLGLDLLYPRHRSSPTLNPARPLDGLKQGGCPLVPNRDAGVAAPLAGKNPRSSEPVDLEVVGPGAVERYPSASRNPARRRTSAGRQDFEPARFRCSNAGGQSAEVLRNHADASGFAFHWTAARGLRLVDLRDLSRFARPSGALRCSRPTYSSVLWRHFDGSSAGPPHRRSVLRRTIVSSSKHRNDAVVRSTGTAYRCSGAAAINNSTEQPAHLYWSHGGHDR